MEYLIILDKDGARVTSYRVGINGADMDALKALAAKDFPGCTYIQDNGQLYGQLLDGTKLYKDGAVVDRPKPPVDPQAEAAAKAAREQREYTATIARFQTRLQLAQLRGDTDEVAKIQKEFNDYQDTLADDDE